MSSVVDYKDRSTCALFGDGAAAVLMEGTTDEGRRSEGTLTSALTARDCLSCISRPAVRYVLRHISPLTTACITSIRRVARCSATP